MIRIILGVVTLLFFYLLYIFYLKPKAELQRYVNLFQKLGYKVRAYPYTIFSNSIIEEEKKTLLQHKDTKYREKNDFMGVDVVVTNIINRVVIMIVNLDLMKEMFTPDKVDIYHKMSFTLRGVTSLLGQGLVLSESDTWRRKRKIISKLFTFEMLLNNIPKIGQIVDRTLDEVEKQLLAERQQSVKQVSFNVKEIGSRIFSTVILTCFLGVDDFSEKIRDQKLPIFIVNLLTKLSSTASTFAVLLLGKYAYRLGLSKQLRDVTTSTNIYRQVCYNLISQRKKAILQKIKNHGISKPNDILEALVVNHIKEDGSTDQSDTMTDKQLFEQLSNFLIAGTDTTSALTQIMVYFIAQNPSVEAKLREIVDANIKSDSDITHDNLKKLEYIDWIQNETLRMGTPVAGIFLRSVQQDHYLGNVPISKGTTISVLPYANQYNSKYFKDPKQFRPERWESECNDLLPFTLIGFSGGPRNCIGKHLALLENKITIVKLLRRYSEIKLPKQQRVMMRRFLYEPLPADLTFFLSRAK